MNSPARDCRLRRLQVFARAQIFARSQCRSLRYGLGLLWVAASAAVAQAPARKPAVPPGEPTRGFAVALISTGIDYTKPAVAARLARDGEGDIVGWDAVDRDRKPFAPDASATRLAGLIPALVAPIRIAPATPATWVEALAFLARSPARVAVLAIPITDPILRASVWPQLQARPDILFVVPAGDENRDLDAELQGQVLPRRADNILVVSAIATEANAPIQPNRGGQAIDLILVPPAAARESPVGNNAMPQTSMDAAALAVGLFSCIDVRGARSAADVKRAWLAKAAHGRPGQAPILSVC
jgi:hypothetical protein